MPLLKSIHQFGIPSSSDFKEKRRISNFISFYLFCVNVHVHMCVNIHVITSVHTTQHADGDQRTTSGVFTFDPLWDRFFLVYAMIVGLWVWRSSFSVTSCHKSTGIAAVQLCPAVHGWLTLGSQAWAARGLASEPYSKPEHLILIRANVS